VVAAGSFYIVGEVMGVLKRGGGLKPIA